MNLATNEKVVLLQSWIKSRPWVVFFSYPAYVLKEKVAKSELRECSQEELSNFQLVFKITETTNIYNSVVNSWKNAGFYLVDSGRDWNILFTGYIRPEALKDVNKHQRINHFPWSYELGRKDRLWKNVAKMKRKFEGEYNIWPPTYIFPIDYKRFIADFKMKENAKAMWIIKPASSSCGRGIKVINGGSKVPK